MADKVLMAVGRRPNTEGLNLEAAGIDYTRKGITVNDRFETNVPGIYAVGDVTGGIMLAHAATYQGLHALNCMCGQQDSIRFDLIPAAVFTIPEVATIGLTEEQCKDYAWMLEQQKGYDVKIDNQSDIWGQIAIQGPDAEKTVIDLFGLDCAKNLGFYEYCNAEYNGHRLIVSRTGYTGEDGFELYATPADTVEIWDRLIKAGIQPCGLGCRDTLRYADADQR